MKALAASVAPWIKRLYSQYSINKLIALCFLSFVSWPSVTLQYLLGQVTSPRKEQERETTRGSKPRTIYMLLVYVRKTYLILKSGRRDSSSVGHTSALSLKLKVASTRFFTRLIFTQRKDSRYIYILLVFSPLFQSQSGSM